MGERQVASFWALLSKYQTERGRRLAPTALVGGKMLGLLHPPGCSHPAPSLGQLGSGGREKKKEAKLGQEAPQTPHLIRIQPHPV